MTVGLSYESWRSQVNPATMDGENRVVARVGGESFWGTLATGIEQEPEWLGQENGLARVWRVERRGFLPAMIFGTLFSLGGTVSAIPILAGGNDQVGGGFFGLAGFGLLLMAAGLRFGTRLVWVRPDAAEAWTGVEVTQVRTE